MGVSKIFNRGEIVEGMLIENGGRTLQINGKLESFGGMLYDSFTQETYAIVSKPLLKYHKNKSKPLHLIDRDAGCTVKLERKVGEQKQFQTIENPESLQINGHDFSGWTCTLERSETLIELVGMAKLMGSAITSEMIRKNFSPPLTGQEKTMLLAVGLIVGVFIGMILF